MQYYVVMLTNKVADTSFRIVRLTEVSYCIIIIKEAK